MHPDELKLYFQKHSSKQQKLSVLITRHKEKIKQLNKEYEKNNQEMQALLRTFNPNQE